MGVGQAHVGPAHVLWLLRCCDPQAEGGRMLHGLQGGGGGAERAEGYEGAVAHEHLVAPVRQGIFARAGEGSLVPRAALLQLRRRPRIQG